MFHFLRLKSINVVQYSDSVQRRKMHSVFHIVRLEEKKTILVTRREHVLRELFFQTGRWVFF